MGYRRFLAVLALVPVWPVRAGDPPDPMELLAKARAKIAAVTRSLPRYTCVETVDRRYFGLVPRGRGGIAPKPCEPILFDHNSGKSVVRLVMTDRLRLDVAVSAKGEIYSWVGASQFDSRPLSEMIGEGVTSTGAFGTHLMDVFLNSAATYRFLRKTTSGHRTLMEYSYRVPTESSHYEVAIPDGVKSQLLGSWYRSGHEGTFTIDAESQELVHLTIRSDVLPPVTQLCQATTSLEYQRLRIGDQDFLLPRTSALELISADGHETRSVTTFSGCRQYGAESTVQFGEEAGAGGREGKGVRAQPLDLPAWLPVTLALKDAIDTDTAAVGDPIRATVAEPVRSLESKQVLVPADAVVKGRITKMERRLLPAALFLIGMAFDSIEVNGVSSPCRLVPDATHQSARQLELTADLPPPETGGYFPFPTGKERVLVPAGFKTAWLTARLGKK